MNDFKIYVFIFSSFPPSATRKLPRLNSEPNGGGFDKDYDGGYGTKVSGDYDGSYEIKAKLKE